MSEVRIVRVRDVMKPQFDLVDGMLTVADALRRMQHAGNKCLIVDKRHEDDEYGIVTIPDIARQVLARDRAPGRVNVYEIMTKPVIAVHPTMDIRYCARLFDRVHISRAPVVDGSRLLGIVSYTDMVWDGLCEGVL